MPRPTPLPAELARRPFTVAEARARGLTHNRLSRGDLRTPFHGVRVPADLPQTLELDCAAAALVLPQVFAFSGVTAAQLCRLPLPWRTPERPLRIRVPAGAVVPALGGMDAGEGLLLGQVHRLRGSGPQQGLPVVHPLHTWCELAPQLPFEDAVALGDAVRRRWAGEAAFAAAVAARAGTPGVVVLRRLVGHIRFKVDSPPETRLRLWLVGAGLPRPDCGQDVSDGWGGHLASPDLSWPDVKVAVEYDGDHHRTDRKQWRRDLQRRELLEQHGWKVLVITAEDMRHRADVVSRVRRVLRERGLTS